MDLKTQRNLAIVVAVAAVVILGGALIAVSLRIPSVGRIKAVGVQVFWDPGCTSEVTEIDWGTLSPGDLAGVTIYIKNTKNTSVNLTLSTNTWEPAKAATYLTLEWNYTEGEILQPGDVHTVLLTMWVDPAVENVDGFSLEIVITAYEQPVT